MAWKGKLYEEMIRITKGHRTIRGTVRRPPEKRPYPAAAELTEPEMLFGVWEIGTKCSGHGGDRHGLKNDLAGAADNGVENAFSDEKHILDTRH